METLDSYTVTEYAVDEAGTWTSTRVELTNLSEAAGAPDPATAEDTRFKPDGTATAPSTDGQTAEELVGANVKFTEAVLTPTADGAEVKSEETVSGEIVNNGTAEAPVPVLETEEGEEIALTGEDVDPQVTAADEVLNPADTDPQAQAVTDEDELLKKLKKKKLLEEEGTDDVAIIEAAATTEGSDNVIDEALAAEAPAPVAPVAPEAPGEVA